MSKIAPFAIAAIFAIMLCGCSNSAQPTQQQTTESSAIAQSDAKLTDEEKTQIANYMQSEEFTALRAAMDDHVNRFLDAAEARDVDTIDEIFLNLSSAVSNLESLEVPPICEKLDYNYKQAARCYIVAVGDFSAYLHGSATEEQLDEANEYIEKGNQFLNDMTAEMDRLTSLAK